MPDLQVYTLTFEFILLLIWVIVCFLGLLERWNNVAWSLVYLLWWSSLSVCFRALPQLLLDSLELLQINLLFLFISWGYLTFKLPTVPPVGPIILIFIWNVTDIDFAIAFILMPLLSFLILLFGISLLSDCVWILAICWIGTLLGWVEGYKWLLRGDRGPTIFELLAAS